jgi:hypothetical protein
MMGDQVEGEVRIRRPRGLGFEAKAEKIHWSVLSQGPGFNQNLHLERSGGLWRSDSAGKPRK